MRVSDAPGKAGTAEEWNVCGYVRLSREDGDKEESNSVTAQKELIREYLRGHPELRECGMRVDDGYTGSDFRRPGFQAMLEDIREGKINCVIVKDLSRFGRDHLEAGEYIERIFPLSGVRFIAINDNYDSMFRDPRTDELIIPFRNLINEAYCRDMSIKTRSQLEVKRRRGEFIGSFSPFGYRKDPENHNRLLVDAFAAGIVRDIFRWKLEGSGTKGIAERLNTSGVPTPMAYKEMLGFNYKTPFRKKEETEWTESMVIRILRNPVYIGTLQQGRVTTPSYKVRRVVRKPREEWAIVEDNHAPIIDKREFELIQRLLIMDTRAGNGGKVRLLSGLVYCGECGAPAVRQTVPSGRERYVYYICSAHKRDSSVCFTHRIRDTALGEIVAESLRRQLMLAGLSGSSAGQTPQGGGDLRLLERLKLTEAEEIRTRTLLNSLYEHLADGLLDSEEYRELKGTYTHRLRAIEVRREGLLEALGRERSGVQERGAERVDRVDRGLTVALVERVKIYRGCRVELELRWKDALFQTATGMEVK